MVNNVYYILFSGIGIIYNKLTINQLQVSKEHLQPIRFQGQYYDVDTGLHYNRFRYYDPDMGMFISRDPIGLMGGDNVFAYAPNPTGWVDPLGLSGVAGTVIRGAGATGEVISGVKGAFHNNFFKVSYSNRVHKDFLVNLLTVKELKSHLLMLAGTTTIPDLNHGAFLSTKIALPHLEEQKAICNEILKQSSKFDKLLGVANQAIQLMQERRTALISAAVTGKIDVRDWMRPESESNSNQI